MRRQRQAFEFFVHCCRRGGRCDRRHRCRRRAMLQRMWSARRDRVPVRQDEVRRNTKTQATGLDAHMDDRGKMEHAEASNKQASMS